MNTKFHSGSQKFTIVAHSVGCLTAMLIEDEINTLGQVANIVCLGSPLEDSPMKLNQGMENILKRIRNKHANRRSDIIHHPINKFIF
jgi:triacylglycerol esterase/lipase EstA (alpha/beta hydrolase family)